ncbi:Succinate-hydroxymethylglutarate -transferase [Hyphodiscus hymeniophilus]|uniref:Succinate-hydroxymethylglutarate -transferase n=1 Tax=Hyphodiscus hymeniophilus TaxID=353542 RepID=A0A9P6VN31_9HELO|nr:Succinate-hydroxymethylglutarate -transferase [Hyphodiscus hymeniophilus]
MKRLSHLPLASLHRVFSTTSNLHSRVSGNGGALEGVKIIDLTRALAGPYCTQILADYGADVIKVEQPGKGDDSRHWKSAGEADKWKDRDGMSYYFASTNRNKRSITVDIKKEKGRQILMDLIKQSDILVDNFIPGKMEEFGLGFDTISKLHPSLIQASISGYGPSGPYSRRGGYDLIAGAEGGLLHITGETDGPPTKPGISIIDVCTGLYMHGAIIAALEARHRTGRGQKVDASLFETQVSMLMNLAASYLNMGQEAKRWGTGHPSIVPYEAFPTRDSYLIVGATNNRQFSALTDLLDDSALAKDERFTDNALRVKNRSELKRILSDHFRTKTTNAWLKKFTDSGITHAPINNIEGAMTHPQIEARNMIKSFQHDAAVNGEIKVVGIPVKFGDTPGSIRQKPPLLGEHTESILKELGESQAIISQLREEGVI